MATVYGAANTLIIHMRECRALETAGVPLDSYVTQNPQSPFAQLLPRAEQHQQVRTLTNTILRRLLPKEDVESPVVMFLLKELLATHLFENILDVCSDPDFINCWIIDYLSEDTEDSVSDAVESGKDLDVFRSVLEKATEDVIAEENRNNCELSKNESDAMPTSMDLYSHVADIQQGYTPQTPRPSRRVTNGHAVERPILPIVSSPLGEVPNGTSALAAEPLSMSPQQQTYLPKDDTRALTTVRKSTPFPASEEMVGQKPMIYATGTIAFNVMDISGGKTMTSKDNLTFVIQIERQHVQESLNSEGGGYVISRTYADFEVFHSILCARHAKRVGRLGLRLPLEPARSWLKLGNNGSTIQPPNDVNSICKQLEKYLQNVVEDVQLGTDQIILAFLRKERSTDADTEVSFAEEYEDEISVYAAISDKNTATHGQSGVGRAMSLLSRAPSAAAKGMMNIAEGLDTMMWDSDGSSSPVEPARRWFGRRSKREGSISSVRTNNSSSKEDNGEESHEPTAMERIKEQVSRPADEPCDVIFSPVSQASVNEEKRRSHHDMSRKSSSSKPLSAVDIELLIETTFALIVEIFDFTAANNKAWMRRSLLNVLREIVRRSYTELVAEEYYDYINKYLSPDGLVKLAKHLKDQHWPDGKFKTDEEKSVRTMEDREKSKQLARTLLMSKAIPGGFRQVIGDQNCSLSMHRLWSRLQDPALNRILMLQLLERVMKPIFG
ncbi:hypothetical protein EC973_006699 [Apophysomyces ossiformis]|uniref:PXA domain-containing protein n=1 Tax=Apophysomyces ossiformis TaxID=679940 RepID=A0A8H7BSZ4_9FUNG|nr:hypothetical protein EC973_006699 [Apophysomyces ossiformis]